MSNSKFNERTLSILNEELQQANIKTRKVGKDQVGYIEAQHAIREANRAFNFEWSNRTVRLEFACAYEKPHKDYKDVMNHYVSYRATVAVEYNGVVHEGSGFGQGINSDLGAAHEGAIKEAESDAKKRALMNFGDIFGLALYDKTKAYVTDQPIINYDQEAEIIKAAEAGNKTLCNTLIKAYKAGNAVELVERCKAIFASLGATPPAAKPEAGQVVMEA